jgi:ubiquinone/menaquinone biosynthesis C-methylase UbiE
MFLRTTLLVSLTGLGLARSETIHPITKRVIAPVMSVEGAPWLDREERAREERPEKALSALGLKPGMNVGDIGAGTGFYSLRVAQRIAPTGVVFANDLQPEMLKRLSMAASKARVANVRTVQGTNTDCKLPENQLDLVLLVDVYHEFSEPEKMLQSIRRSLKPDGRLVLLEFRKEDEAVPIRLEHKMSVSEVRAEVQPEGFRFQQSIETLPWQHILIFRPDQRKPQAR